MIGIGLGDGHWIFAFWSFLERGDVNRGLMKAKMIPLWIILRLDIIICCKEKQASKK